MPRPRWWPRDSENVGQFGAVGACRNSQGLFGSESSDSSLDRRDHVCFDVKKVCGLQAHCEKLPGQGQIISREKSGPRKAPRGHN